MFFTGSFIDEFMIFNINLKKSISFLVHLSFRNYPCIS